MEKVVYTMNYLPTTLLIGICLSNVSCAGTKATATKATYYTASIEETEKGVTFTAKKPTKMSLKREGVEYHFDSQSESLISKIVSILTLGAIGVNRE